MVLPKQRLFDLFGVSRSGYYDYLKRLPSQRTLFNQQPDKKLDELFKLYHGLYGYRRLHDCLLDEGYSLSQERVRRRMSHLNLKTKQRKKYKQTTNRQQS